MPSVVDLSAAKHAQELRESWQGRALAATRTKALGMVVLSVLAHNYDEAMHTLLLAVFPGFKSISAPFLSTAGRIAKTGHVMADVVHRNGTIEKNRAIFLDAADMQSHFRRLADELKLSDDDRREMFGAVQRWLVADYRIDPTMNPSDPEARRLALN